MVRKKWLQYFRLRIQKRVKIQFSNLCHICWESIKTLPLCDLRCFRISRVIPTLCGRTSDVRRDLRRRSCVKHLQEAPGVRDMHCTVTLERRRLPFYLIEASAAVWGSAGRKASALNLSPPCTALNRKSVEPRRPFLRSARCKEQAHFCAEFSFFCNHTHTHAHAVLTPLLRQWLSCLRGREDGGREGSAPWKSIPGVLR